MNMEQPKLEKNPEALEVYLRGKDESSLTKFMEDPYGEITTVGEDLSHPTDGFSDQELMEAAKVEIASRKA
jgi:hypothetical protein